MNSPRFTRFTPAHQPGDVFVRGDVVTSVQPNAYSGALFSGKLLDTATAINTTGGGTVIVKESPAQVIEALRAAGDTKDVSIEIVMPDEEPVGLRALIDDIENLSEIALLMEQRDEAIADAKIADERAEWYRKVAEKASAELSLTVNENTRLQSENIALKQQLAAAKDATAGAIATERSAHSLQIAALNNEKQKAEANAAYYKQIADSRLDMLGHKQSELDRYATEIGTEIAKSANLRDERDQLLAKLKDTTAALEKANCELNAARYDKFWRGDGWSKNGFIGNVTGLPKPD